ncbi:MAG: DUF4238 domain-containing protein [Qipengyuania sp.]|nr:DUF4238 domain-containing protein [Qipengyuania sp.]
MTSGAPKRHHYVPQFYLRRFALSDDPKKVAVLEQHRDFLVADRKSISRIAYEDGLHDYAHDGDSGSIEHQLNETIETPFSASATWSKISGGGSHTLDERDKLAFYGFARHLQSRNLETLRFIETENARFLAGELDTDLTDEEREMHRWIAASPDGAHAMFRAGSLDTSLPADAALIDVMVCRSPIPLRTSTSPTVRISHPGRKSVFGSMFDSLRTWWLSLDRHCGAFIIAGGPAGFSNATMPLDAARMVNRQYLVQQQNSRWVRYLIADDDFLASDLEWAGYRFEERTKNGFRYRKESARP